jgi:hypothetical protein
VIRLFQRGRGALRPKSRVGPHSAALCYGRKGEEKLSGAGFSDLSDSKAKQVSARYGYSLSRRTQLDVLRRRQRGFALPPDALEGPSYIGGVARNVTKGRVEDALHGSFHGYGRFRNS